jgi:hypothetical protein
MGLLMWGALSDERTVCSLQLLLGIASAVILVSDPRGAHDHFTFLTPPPWREAAPQGLCFPVPPFVTNSHFY